MTAQQEERFAEDNITKLLAIAASDKIQILSAPIQLPGVCGLCGTSRNDDRQYVDIGLWLEYYGQFYFCTMCMTQMVNRLGGLTPEQAEKLNDELEQARQTILDFQNEKAAYDGAINTLRSTGLFSGTDITVVGSVMSVASESIKSEGDGVSSGNKSRVISSIDDSYKTPTEQRPHDVSSSGSNELDSWL